MAHDDAHHPPTTAAPTPAPAPTPTRPRRACGCLAGCGGLLLILFCCGLIGALGAPTRPGEVTVTASGPAARAYLVRTHQQVLAVADQVAQLGAHATQASETPEVVFRPSWTAEGRDTGRALHQAVATLDTLTPPAELAAFHAALNEALQPCGRAGSLYVRAMDALELAHLSGAMPLLTQVNRQLATCSDALTTFVARVGAAAQEEAGQIARLVLDNRAICAILGSDDRTRMARRGSGGRGVGVP